MRKADFRQEGYLNDKNIQLVYEKKKRIIEDLLKISTVEEFLEVFDDDMDGLLNEDEQILVFSIIKTRIQIIAEELCMLKKYDLYKELMREVREIEALIVKYQHELRNHVHLKQLNDYINIGDEIVDDFQRNWDSKKNNYEEKVRRNLTTKELVLRNNTEEKHNQGVQKYGQIKLKPSNKMRLLQLQEKLVAINERIEEAANYRNELRILEKKDEERLLKIKGDLNRNLKKDLERQEKLEFKKLKDFYDAERNKLTIQQNKETNILHKQINLHVNDIKRIQNQITNFYDEEAKKGDEMIRTRERQVQTNKVLSTFKGVKTFSGAPASGGMERKREIALALLNLGSKSISLNVSMESSGGKEVTTKKSSLALKFIIKNHRPLGFEINGDFSSKKFCNVPENHDLRNDNNLKNKIRKLLDQRKHQDEIFISPTAYYDNNLNIVCDAKDYRDLLPMISK